MNIRLGRSAIRKRKGIGKLTLPKELEFGVSRQIGNILLDLLDCVIGIENFIIDMESARRECGNEDGTKNEGKSE